MGQVTHLKSLQALEMAIREGSLRLAAERLGITPAAVGQRIRSLEEYIGTDLLLRGRSGLQPTKELEFALADLRQAFAALERVTDTLDFQRVSEIHVVADPDLAELWLLPRLETFREQFPNILFCINGEGDVPVRLGSPDIRIFYGEGEGEPLFQDLLLPISGPDNLWRIATFDSVFKMEGLPLLHLDVQQENASYPGWTEWFEKYGLRASGAERGINYKNARLALESVRQNVGFLCCGLSFVLSDLENGLVVLPFPASQSLEAPYPYRLVVSQSAERRPQIQSFLSWLRNAASDTSARMVSLTG